MGKRLALATVAAMALAAGIGSASAKDWKTVRIGMDASFAPFESVDSSGAIVGFEVDYAKALCAKMKVTCTFQNQDWDGIIPSLMANKFDVILSSMNITDERKKTVAFSKPYYMTMDVMVGKTDNKSDDITPDTLKGKAIGTQTATTESKYLEKYYPNAELRLYPTQDESNADLQSGRVDYVVGDRFVEEAFVKDKGKDCCRIIGILKHDADISGPGMGAAFRPADKDLREMFDKAITSAASDGTFKKLNDQYFPGVDISVK